MSINNLQFDGPSLLIWWERFLVEGENCRLPVEKKRFFQYIGDRLKRLIVNEMDERIEDLEQDIERQENEISTLESEAARDAETIADLEDRLESIKNKVERLADDL